MDDKMHELCEECGMIASLLHSLPPHTLDSFSLLSHCLSPSRSCFSRMHTIDDEELRKGTQKRSRNRKVPKNKNTILIMITRGSQWVMCQFPISKNVSFFCSFKKMNTSRNIRYHKSHLLVPLWHVERGRERTRPSWPSRNGKVLRVCTLFSFETERTRRRPP